MSVVNVIPTRTLHQQSRSRVDAQTENITYNKAWTVLCDDPINDNEGTARHAQPDIPVVGDPHPDDPLVPCVHVDADRVNGSATLFLVRAIYSLDFPVQLTGQGIPDPLSRPYKIQGGSVRSSELIDNDADGMPLTNAVGEPYDPPLSEEIYDPRLVITRVEAFMPFDRQADYTNTVNTFDFAVGSKLVNAGQARMYDINYTDFIEKNPQGQNTRYYEVTYEIHFRFQLAPDNFGIPTPPDKAWHRRIAHTGLYVRDSSSPIGRRRIVDGEGKDVVTPVPLSPDGFAVVEPNTTVFRFHRRFLPKDWTPLDLFS